MQRWIAATGVLLLAWPHALWAADGDPAPPAWAAALESRVSEANERQLSTEGIGLDTAEVPLARTGLSGRDGATCRALRFRPERGSAHFTEILLCPWDDLIAVVPPPGEILFAAPLWTVADTALVFGPWLGPDGVPTDEKRLTRVTEVVGAALDVEALEAPCTGNPTPPPEGVQLMEAECRRHYVSLKVALPGSRVPTDDELRAAAPGKMVELWLMPDRGEVVHRWLAPAPVVSEPAAGEPTEDTPVAGEPAVDAPDGDAPAPLDPPPVEGPFADYAPKVTPDTVLDYRGELAPRLAELPPETYAALPELVLLLQRQRRQALTEPGVWISGNVILGGDEHEYVPSHDELIEAFLGERLARVIQSVGDAEVRAALDNAGVDVAEVTYRTFTFRHVDVMGSGRYFYASPPEERTLTLR